MNKRNDLSAYKPESKKVLTSTLSKPRERAGRPKKETEEKRTRKVLLSFTALEEQKIKNKAGLVPVATYLTEILKKSGIFD